VHNGEPYVIELAARLSGGLLLHTARFRSTRRRLHRAAIKVALGEPVTAGRTRTETVRAGHPALCLPEPGNVVSVSGAEERARFAGVTEVVVTRARRWLSALPATSVPPLPWFLPPVRHATRAGGGETMRWPV